MVLIEPRRAARRSWPDSFADRLTAPLAGYRDMMKLAREVAPWRGGMPFEEVDRIPVRRDGLPAVPATATAVTWVGHATFVVQVGGLRVLTDPVWSRRIPGIRPRFVPPGVAWSELGRVDAVVISHNHYDHLDAPTVRRLPRDTPVLAPAGLAGWFRQRGFTDVTDLDWWESVEIGGVAFDFVPAHHWSRRGLTDTCRSLWGGWVLTAPGGRRVYFAGDTGYGHWFAEIADRYPGIDVALLPVGAYHPRWFMNPVHMDPEQAVRARGELGARHLASMHWGTFAMTSEPVLEPLHRLRAAWDAAGHARGDLWDLAIGESRRLD
jgi:L-ascorbate metabolism protein UlaG (beta-lactamase superfamily)